MVVYSDVLIYSIDLGDYCIHLTFSWVRRITAIPSAINLFERGSVPDIPLNPTVVSVRINI